jgi:HrpA-like RNA helicase
MNVGKHIMYMTNDMLLRDFLDDPDLLTYSVVMLGKGHERTVHTDLLFNLCKATSERRPGLKLIIMSLTREAEKFSAYFDHCLIFTILGHMIPVKILHSRDTKTKYLEASISTVMQIHMTHPPGDMLVLMTG